MSEKKRWTVIGLKGEIDTLAKKYQDLLTYSEENDITMQGTINSLCQRMDTLEKELIHCSASFRRIYILSISTAILMFATIIIVVL